MLTTEKIINTLLEGLNQRQQEIIIGRFGLKKSQEPQTLATLGERYDITRERVRQIEAGALQLLRKKIEDESAIQEFLTRGQKYLKTAGGIAKREELLEYLRDYADGITANQLSLLLKASGAFQEHREDEEYRNLYYLDKQSFRIVSQFIDQLTKFLKPRKEDILSGKFREHLNAFLAKERYQAAHAEHFLAITKKLHTNPYGDTGLSVWPEIKPQTIRDRIYLILKKKSEPLHFRIITKAINEAGFERRPALVPTVHNELIKDPRFVLVGRGIYALTEHGYEPGTAREVIGRILKKQGALSLPQIINVVQKERFFKSNTIVANLQNKNYFKRLDNGRYELRES